MPCQANFVRPRGRRLQDPSVPARQPLAAQGLGPRAPKASGQSHKTTGTPTVASSHRAVESPSGCSGRQSVAGLWRTTNLGVRLGCLFIPCCGCLKSGARQRDDAWADHPDGFCGCSAVGPSGLRAQVLLIPEQVRCESEGCRPAVDLPVLGLDLRTTHEPALLFSIARVRTSHCQ